MEAILNLCREALGLELKAEELNAGQAALRGILVFLAGLILVRLGHKRFLGKSTAFDLIVGIMLGAVLSRGITGNAPLAVSIAGGAALVAVHWLFAAAAFHSHRVGNLVKGRPRVLVRDGELEWRHMRRSHISEHDLVEALRSNAHVAGADEVKEARLERSGEISVLRRQHEPRIIEFDVGEGVHRVRIELA
jgi:uncharacterized membrane protein YcaP (DUF421 family)